MKNSNPLYTLSLFVFIISISNICIGQSKPLPNKKTSLLDSISLLKPKSILAKDFIKFNEAANPYTYDSSAIFSEMSFKKNTVIRLPNLTFIAGESTIAVNGKADLDTLLTILMANPTMTIEIHGHICCRQGGLDGFDPSTGQENLSWSRARAVEKHLARKGINKKRMNSLGFGSAKKIYPGDYFDTWKQNLNRRIEIKITTE